MKVHHLNCAILNPCCAGLLYGDTPPAHRHMVCHVLLIETTEGLVLVDTGFGMDDVSGPRARLGRAFHWIGRPALKPEQTAVAQVRALGFEPADVRHIIVTHLDLDHAGGLGDFPHAKVHIFEAERAVALTPRFADRGRYKPVHWAHGPDWCAHQDLGEPWFGFECVRQLAGLPPEILLVPLVGHTRGHCGVAVDGGAGWLLHCGDAYFHHGEMQTPPTCPVGLRLFQRLVQVDGAARLSNQARLRALAAAHSDEVTLFCAHDPSELARLQAGAES